MREVSADTSSPDDYESALAEELVVSTDGNGMQSCDDHEQWGEGMRDSLPILPAVIPFAALYGAVAVEAGFSTSDTLLASATIYAGASQYVMLDLLGQQVPAWSIVFAVFAVNFRHVLYSASIGRHLTRFSAIQKLLAFALLIDPQFAAAEQRARTPGGIRPSYYFGYALCIYVVWIVCNAIGVVFGQMITDPAMFGLDFILPLYFLALVLGFRGTHRFVPIALVSAIVSIVSVQVVGSPWNITLGGLSGLVVAAILSQEPATR